MNKPELLAPAGSLEKGRMALLYGADAVYLGGKAFGLRAFAANFSLEEIRELAAFAHAGGKKVYVTVNIYPHNSDLTALPEYLRNLEEAGVDALLVSDLGVWMTARKTVPKLGLHVSTQANVTNWAAAKAWEELGAERVVLARELSIQEIREIREKISADLEVFVHGAMCISYSGRCLLSNYFTGRDSNRGACAQVCRWEFGLTEKNRPGEVFPIAEDERGTYIMNSKDLCLMEYLPQLMEAGVSSLKIEGRMKSVHYVATVVSAYRKAIDLCWQDPAHFTVPESLREELEKVSHRPYTTGFAVRRTGPEDQVYTTSSYEQSADFVALVKGFDPATGRAALEQRNHVKEGQQLEVLTPGGEIFSWTLEEMQDGEGNPIQAAPHAQMIFTAKGDSRMEPFSLVRRLKG
ncbi:peptidase U32 family protein [Acidaminococcus massiliensis]|uniref:peptidase U32 family protein n=1 Tax=Acidaminococcus massiliensis TaxID=1852375 RepID=UPI00266D4E08|nr:U32 family peptidase [Acidaminococcus massiliensis]